MFTISNKQIFLFVFHLFIAPKHFGMLKSSKVWLFCFALRPLLLLSHFSRVRLCATPSLGFPRQEHWSGLPFPSPMHKSEK